MRVRQDEPSSLVLSQVGICKCEIGNVEARGQYPMKAVLVEKFEQLSCGVFVECVVELCDGWRDLQALV
jgi:hypothetical protein